MAEALFYHLTTHTLERALPNLLERTLVKGWRAVIRVTTSERLEALDAALWTYRDDAFLPHGTAATLHPEKQPLYLTSGDELPNKPNALFLVEGADTADFALTERTIIMFDGAREDAVALARQQWLRAAASVPATYWRQDMNGRWEKAAESNKTALSKD